MENSSEAEFDLKKEYGVLKEKYGLPSFDEISEDFDIEKLDDKETSHLMREIRRVLMDKLSAYLNLFENLVNPSGPPMFIFSALRSMDNSNKPKLREIYKRLSKIQIGSMKLDTIYNEDLEAKFVKDIFSSWQEIKKEIYTVFDDFDKNFDKENGSKESRYFD